MSRSHPNFLICQIKLPKCRYCFIMSASYFLQTALQKSTQPIPSPRSVRSPPTCKPFSIFLCPSGRTTNFTSFRFQCNKMTLGWMQCGYYQYTIFHCLQINPFIILFSSTTPPRPAPVPHPLVSGSGQCSWEGRPVSVW